MYSYEIDQTIRSQDHNIDSETYLYICQSSPQISRVKYDSYDSKYEIWTKDNFYWKINIYRKENKL